MFPDSKCFRVFDVAICLSDFLHYLKPREVQRIAGGKLKVQQRSLTPKMTNLDELRCIADQAIFHLDSKKTKSACLIRYNKKVPYIGRSNDVVTKITTRLFFRVPHSMPHHHKGIETQTDRYNNLQKQ